MARFETLSIWLDASKRTERIQFKLSCWHHSPYWGWVSYVRSFRSTTFSRSLQYPEAGLFLHPRSKERSSSPSFERKLPYDINWKAISVAAIIRCRALFRSSSQAFPQPLPVFPHSVYIHHQHPYTGKTKEIVWASSKRDYECSSVKR